MNWVAVATAVVGVSQLGDESSGEVGQGWGRLRDCLLTVRCLQGYR